MKVLAAAAESDPRAEGFSYAIPGELVYIGVMCDTDARSEDLGRGGCGCGRAFAGATSKRATTLAVVREMNIGRDTYVDVMSAAIRDALGDEDVTALAEAQADCAAELEVGTLLVRAGDEVFPLNEEL